MKSINRVARDDDQFIQSAKLKRLLTRVVGLGNNLGDFFDVFSACLGITHWSDKGVRSIFKYPLPAKPIPHMPRRSVPGAIALAQINSVTRQIIDPIDLRLIVCL